MLEDREVRGVRPSTSGTPVLAGTRFIPPEAAPAELTRLPLLERVEARDQARMLAVSAPAGYGKSTFLAQWTRRRPGRIAWVTLDRHDRELGQFWSILTEALDRSLPGAFTPARQALRGIADPTATAVPLVVNGLLRAGEPVLLVLDDYQEATSDAVDAALSELVDRLPASTQIAIGTRRDPLVSVARWRAAGQLVECRQADLRFSRADIGIWLEHLGLELPDGSVDRLAEVTEGWPAALSLAVTPILDGLAPDQVLSSLDGRDRFIGEYLTEELLRKQSSESLRMLRVAAVLQRFSAELLGAVVEEDAADWLAHGVRSNLLISPLDVGRRWYQMHHLLAEHLAAQLAADDPGWVARIRARAARWHDANGSSTDAIDLAMLSGDRDLAAELINRNWRAMVNEGRVGTIRGQLREFTAEELASDARLLVTGAWIAAIDGDWPATLAALEAVSRLPDRGSLPDGTPSVAVAAAAIRGVFTFDGVERALADGRIALDALGPGDPLRPYVQSGLGFASLLAGDLADAWHYSRLAAMATDDPLLRINSLVALILVAVERHDLDTAARKAAQAEELMRRHQLQDLPRTAGVEVARAAVLHAHGRHDAAADLLWPAVERFRGVDTGDSLDAMVRLADVLLAIGDRSRARSVLGEAREILGSWPDAGRLPARIAALEARAVDPPVENEALASLSDREHEVLDLLAATHLTQPEIADRLFVSPETVKSHVRSIYRKLGASSRQDAARALGPSGGPSRSGDPGRLARARH